MPKNLIPAMRAHLNAETTRLAAIWRITRRDGQQFFFTDHDRDIVFGGDVYRADAGFERTAIRSDAGFAVDNLDLLGVFAEGGIVEDEVRAGLQPQLLDQPAGVPHPGARLRRTQASDPGPARRVEGINKSYISRILRLALLAPDIIETALEGRSDQTLMLETLERPLPASWEEQRNFCLAEQPSL